MSDAGRRLAGSLVLAALAGCAAGRPAPLPVPEGHRMVLGRVDLTRFAETGALVLLIRDDRAYLHDLDVGAGRQDFAITLPRGRYRVAEIRTAESGSRSAPAHAVIVPGLAFEVGDDPAVYVGTLRLSRDFDQRVMVAVVDELVETLAVLRARYPNIPATVAPSLLRP